MNVLLTAFACTPNWGSEPTVGWNWTYELSKYHNVILITRPEYQTGLKNKEIIDEYINENNIKNIKVVYYLLPSIFNFLHRERTIHIYFILWEIGLYFYIKNNLDYNKVDIFHHLTHNEFRNPGILWRFNKPFVLGPLGGGTKYPKGFADIFGFSIFREKFRDLINLLFKNSLYLKTALKKADFVFVADRSTYSYLPSKFRYKYIKLLETGIRIKENFQNEKTIEQRNYLNILWVGNIIPRKSLPLLIKALQDININYRLKVIGDGFELEKNKKLAKNLGVFNNIDFTGKLSYLEVQKYYSSADVFVFTSLRDTSGNVVLEAMSNGLPIICLDHNGVADMVTEECGIKITPKNSEYVVSKLREAIIEMNGNNIKRMKMGANALERVKNTYCWEKKGEIMDGYYKTIAKNKELI